MKGRWIRWSPAELAFIERHRKLPRQELHAKFVAEFGRHDVSFESVNSLCKRNGWRNGRDCRITKGSVPANKGKKMPFNPNSARTQFKKGQRPQNTKWAGHERVGSHGYVEISINETNPHTGFERRYVLKHRWLWERLHGPLPDGMVLKCKGDVLNTDPSNWEAVPRGVLPRLSARFGRGYDAAPDELKPVIMAVAKLEHQIAEKKRRPR